MNIFRFAAALAVASWVAGPAAAQTVQPRIVVGTNPVALAVNPVTGKVYVANAGSNNISIIDGTTVSSLPVGTQPRWIGVNPETNRVLVGNFTSANVTIVNG
ncbi:MAG: YncE family protein, partial [Gemmatimonadales bacterium]